MSRSLLLGASCVFSLLGCSGPPAPDVALCRDVIHRLCIAPMCQVVKDRFASEENCEPELLAKTGCESDDFQFVEPSRERFLQCRNILVQSGIEPETAPACGDVEQMLNQCGEMVTFLGGGAQ